MLRGKPHTEHGRRADAVPFGAAMNTAEDLVLAIDVGGTGLSAEIVDRAGGTRLEGTAATPGQGGAAATRAVIDLATDLLDRLPPSQRRAVRGVGLAVPGVVDTERGIAVLSANVGWREEPVRDQVRAALDLPVVLEHDVTAAGTAEFRCGAARGVDNALVVVIGTGIAAVIISDGRVLRGGPHQAGELGHVVVRPDGPPCPCGQQGCLETLASAAAIARGYTAATGRAVTGAAEVHGLLGQDADADHVWWTAVDALADGLLTACTLLAPDRIVLAGGLAEAGRDLLEPIRELLATRAKVAGVPSVTRTELGGRAGVLGAALGAWERLPSGAEAG